MSWLCKKSSTGLHKFQIVGGDCLFCGESQIKLSFPKTKIKEKSFFERMAELKKQKFQYTRHQQDAIETAELFNDMKSKGIYLRLFKAHDREKLLKCREWVDKKGRGNKGRLFVAVYKKFL